MSDSNIGNGQCNLFNYEVERRIQDRLAQFLAVPEETNQVITTLRDKEGFPSGSLRPSDRDQFLKNVMSLPSNLLYVYYEDGFGMGYDPMYNFAYYREPGAAGYSVDDPAFQPWLKSCVDSFSGEQKDCLLEPGQPYIRYSECDGEDDQCDLYEPCPDSDSQTLPDCSDIQALQTADVSQEDCLARKKWCRKYSIETAEPLSNDETRTGLGYIPDGLYCYNEKSQVTQTPGDAFAVDGSGETGSTCVYEDGVTPVIRTLSGPYSYCGDNGEICNSTFVGNFNTPEYDARYRPWYIGAKARQTPHWSDPYVYETGYIGLTHVHPHYTKTDRGLQFDGVIGIDYRFEDFSIFLVDNYKDSNTIIAIFEDKAPYYVIGVSTGTQASARYLISDPMTLCPSSLWLTGDDCISERLQIKDIRESKHDDVILEAFLQHEVHKFPNDLLFVKMSPDDVVGGDIWVSQTTLYNAGISSNLQWRILIISPASEGIEDVIMAGDPLFGPLIMFGSIGVLACAYFCWYIYSKRRIRAIAFADWKFTCLFVAGCGLLNTSTFTLLGQNTEGTCLARMWSFHLFFVMALSPLFVKVWRMYRLTESSYKRTTITSTTAAIYTMPLILLQIVILALFTILDPPKPSELITNNDKGVSRQIVCDSETNALFIAQVTFEAGLVFTGCVLAYLQRNMDDRFGETKHMLIAMYNIALVGIILLVVTSVSDLEGSATKLLQAVGVLWGSVISAAAFVVPRMIQIQQGASLRRGSNIQVSGAFSISDTSGHLVDNDRCGRAPPEAPSSTVRSKSSGLENIPDEMAPPPGMSE